MQQGSDRTCIRAAFCTVVLLPELEARVHRLVGMHVQGRVTDQYLGTICKYHILICKETGENFWADIILDILIDFHIQPEPAWGSHEAQPLHIHSPIFPGQTD